MTGTKCPYCGAGWSGKNISARHVARCAKKQTRGTAGGASAGVSTTYTPADGHDDSPTSNYGESWDNYQQRVTEPPHQPEPETVTGFGETYTIAAPPADGPLPTADITAARYMTAAEYDDVEWANNIDTLVDECFEKGRAAQTAEEKEHHAQIATGLMVAHCFVTERSADTSRTVYGEDPYEHYPEEDRTLALKSEAMVRHDRASTPATPFEEWHTTRTFLATAREQINNP